MNVSAGETDFRSWLELRDSGVVRQRWDFSCGLASLATLLTHYFGDPVTEQVLLDALPEKPGRDKQGVSLQDLASLAVARGYRTAGLRIDVDALRSLDRPAIVYLELEGQPHFSVLRGIDSRGRVLLADPSAGNRRASAVEFARWFGLEQTNRGRLLLVDSGAARTVHGDYFSDRPLEPLLAPRLTGGMR